MDLTADSIIRVPRDVRGGRKVKHVAVAGANRIELEVTNTWFNRLTGDAGLPDEEKRTWVLGGGFGRALSADSPLIPAGLLGPVTIKSMVKV